VGNSNQGALFIRNLSSSAASSSSNTTLQPTKPTTSQTPSEASTSNASPNSNQELQIKMEYLSAEPVPFAKGGQGAIHKGTYYGKAVAVKYPTLSSEAYDDFLKEANAWHPLRHTNILQLLGVSLEPKPLLIMELMACSLYDMIHDSKETFPWPTRLQYALDITSGLTYLHSVNLLHRDLKSMNVLISHDKQTAKLCDFGMTRLKLDNSSIQTQRYFCGTPQWMAPELFNNEKPDKSTDIYALGMTFFEILTRTVPWKSNSPMQIASSLSRNERPYRTYNYDQDSEPPTFWPLIQKCWDSDRKSRPDAATILKLLIQLIQNPAPPIASSSNILLPERSHTLTATPFKPAPVPGPHIILPERSNTPTATPFKPGAVAAAEPPKKTATMYWAYAAQNLDEHTLAAGDIITIIKLDDGGWSEAEFKGKVGFVPSAYYQKH